MIRSLALLLLLLAMMAAALADSDEDRVRAAITGKVDDVKIEGEWAAADCNQGEYEQIAVLHKVNGRWKLVERLGGRGPMTPRSWQGLGMSPAQIALFGFGDVPKAVRDALIREAHSEEPGGGLYCIATHGKSLFASTRGGADRTVIWEYVRGQWKRIFAWKPPQNPDRIFEESGLSRYMQRRLVEGECAASGKY